MPNRTLTGEPRRTRSRTTRNNPVQTLPDVAPLPAQPSELTVPIVPSSTEHAIPQAPVATRRQVVHSNGALETTFQVQLTQSLSPQAHELRLGAISEGVEETVPAGQAQPIPTQSQSHAPPSEEEIEIPSFSSSASGSPSPSSSRAGSPSRGPVPVMQVPRAGRHSRNQARPRASPSKSYKKTYDLRPFYQESEGRRVCKFCLKAQAAGVSTAVKSYSNSTSTTVLRAHFVESHLEEWVDACDSAKPPIEITAQVAIKEVEEYRRRNGQPGMSGGRQNNGPQSKPYSKEAFIDALVAWIVSDDQSLNVVENKYLREVFLLLRAELKDSDIPHRTTIREKVMNTWQKHVEALEKDISEHALGKVSATMDMWTDPNLTPFMAVTIHWMEGKMKQTPAGPQYEVRLRSDLAGFMRVPGQHTGEHLLAAFQHIIDRIGVAAALGWVTMDNASNNDRFVSLLEVSFSQRRIPFKAAERRIRCFPHIVNIACKAVIGAITNMDYAREAQNDADREQLLNRVNGDAIATLRAFIRAVRSSPLRIQHFAAITRDLHGENIDLVRDVDTRWSSTYLMLDRAIALRDSIEEMIRRYPRDFSKYSLSDDDWDTIESVCLVLEIPHAFQQLLSPDKTPSLGKAIPAFEALRRKWEEVCETYPELECIVQPGVDKLQNYRELADSVPAYVMSMILTPAERLSYYENFDQANLTSAKHLFIETLRPYHEKVRQCRAAQTARPARAPSAPSFSRASSSVPAPHRPTQAAGRYYQARSVSGGQLAAADILGLRGPSLSTNDHDLIEEVNAYLFDKSIGTDSVAYWQENQLRYPTLFLAAMDYLAIQGSAVPCERVFSSAKETMTTRRNRISAELMEALQMLKYSLNHGGQALDFTAGTSLDDEMGHLLEAQTEDYLPSDATDFSIMLATRFASLAVS